MSFDNKQYYHNKGQEDAKKGRYDEPHGVIDDLATWTKSGMEKNIEDNKAYREGRAHAKGQADGARNSYNPPSDKDAKKTYDSVWRDSYDHEHSKSGGCFLTTACVHAMGLPDDCEELRVLRGFRDGYLSALPGGDKMIAEYYNIAPPMVEAINQSPDAALVYANVFAELVKPVVGLIRAGEHEAAISLYRSYVEQLRAAFRLPS